LPDGTDAAQIAFELGVILAGTDIVSVLHDDLHAISRARTAIYARLAWHASQAPGDNQDAD
jgi:hypothetical protein